MSRFNILKSREDLKSVDLKIEQQSKTLVEDQLEGEALNMLNLTSCIKLCPSMKENYGLSIAGYGYEPGHSFCNTRVIRHSDPRRGHCDNLSFSEEELEEGFRWEDSGK